MAMYREIMNDIPMKLVRPKYTGKFISRRYIILIIKEIYIYMIFNKNTSRFDNFLK